MVFIGEIETAPSIGSIGRICLDSENDRLKGLLTQQVDSKAELMGLLEMSLSGLDPSSASRVTLRCFAGPDLRRLSNFLGLNYSFGPFRIGLEAAVPLNGRGHLLYLGDNLESRIPSSRVIANERRLTNLARQAAQRPARSLPNGYHASLLPPGFGLESGDLNDVVGIYAQAYRSYTVDLGLESVGRMVRNGLTGIVRNLEGQIVSLTVGEIVQAGRFSLCEISDSATDPGEATGGLNIQAKMAVIGELVRRNIDVIFTETRANQAAVQIGNFRLGLEPCGFLPWHCQISSELTDVVDPTDQGFGSLIVFSLSDRSRRQYEEIGN